MKKPFILLLLMLVGCQGHIAPSYSPQKGDWAHLSSYGYWGYTEIWILPDDAFFFYDKSAVLPKPVKYRGFRPGVFSSLIDLVNRHELWGITTFALEADRDHAQGKWRVMLPTDCELISLQIEAEGKSLSASSYAPGYFARKLPKAHLLKSFAQICAYLYQETAPPCGSRGPLSPASTI